MTHAIANKIPGEQLTHQPALGEKQANGMSLRGTRRTEPATEVQMDILFCWAHLHFLNCVLTMPTRFW